MIAVNKSLLTAPDLLEQIASRVKARRLQANLTQKTLALRSGISYGSVKKFESTGQISLAALLKLAVTLGAVSEFTALFPEHPDTSTLSLDALLNTHTRKRGRK